jgi:hypothetical protein
MLRRVVRGESGMAMGLAVIMIVLIGVMGAGLLVFVRNDLEAVVEANQGQRALDAADAGVQAAKRQLLSDAIADATTNTYDNNANNGDSPWSPNSGGKNLTFDGNSANVKVQYLLPATTSTQLSDPNHAPELVPAGATDYPEPKDYFKITSEGTAGEARRKIEAIYSTEDLNVAKGYFTPSDITISDSANIRNVSLFALGNVTINGNPTITGEDRAYGNWYNPPFNATARGTDAAGIGAVGTISTKVSGRDYDRITTPTFIRKDPPQSSQTTSQISFPFNYALPDLDFLRDEAKLQGNYHEVSGGTVSISSWPANSSSRTVVFYKFTSFSSNTLKWSVPGTCTDNPPTQGTLVVENGNFTTQPNKALFRGVVIVRGGEVADGTSEDTGRTCLQGFVNAEGNITIAGNVTPMGLSEADKHPGFYSVRLWSWRELYQ